MNIVGADRFVERLEPKCDARDSVQKEHGLKLRLRRIADMDPKVCPIRTTRQSI